jgi:hypothetical protein
MRKAGIGLFLLLSGCWHSGVKPLKPLAIPLSTYLQAAPEKRAGSLMYENDCLLFREDGTGATLMPIWPYGSSFNGTAVLFHEPGKADQRLMVAEELVLEGQSADWANLPAEFYQPFQRRCSAPPFYVSKARPAN